MIGTFLDKLTHLDGVHPPPVETQAPFLHTQGKGHLMKRQPISIKIRFSLV